MSIRPLIWHKTKEIAEWRNRKKWVLADFLVEFTKTFTRTNTGKNIGYNYPLFRDL